MYRLAARRKTSDSSPLPYLSSRLLPSSTTCRVFDSSLLLLFSLLSSSSSSSSCGLAVCAGWVVPLVSPLRLLPSLHPRLLVTFNFERDPERNPQPRTSSFGISCHQSVTWPPNNLPRSLPIFGITCSRPVLRVLLVFFPSSAIASAGPGKNHPIPNSTWPGTEPAVCVLRVLCGCAGDLKIGCHYRPNLQR